MKDRLLLKAIVLDHLKYNKGKPVHERKITNKKALRRALRIQSKERQNESK